MYGWRDFDPAVVAELPRGGLRPGVNDEHGMLCPLKGHDAHWLPWREVIHPGSPQGVVRRSNGTATHGELSARFYASPTFVHDNQLENIITGQALVGRLAAAGKAESRLGHEGSEDAVSWNVFRSLQEAGMLGAAAHLLIGVQPSSEPELYMWSVQVEARPDRLTPWARLKQVRNELEPGFGQQTEPDVCLYIHGWGWVLIEAKLGSKTTLCRDEAHLARWKKHYTQEGRGAAVLNLGEVQKAKRHELPEQLMRNILFADRLRAPGEHAAVVALTRNHHQDPTNSVERLVANPTTVPLHHRTWEQLYHDLCVGEDSLDGLRFYYERKSLNLRVAFKLTAHPDSTTPPRGGRSDGKPSR